MIFKKEDAFCISKNGVDMRIYNGKDQCLQAAVVYQETAAGHFEEFYHSTSYFIFYIIEGEGVWYINSEPSAVKAGDVVIVPPNNKFYYTGNLKQVCVTSPAWDEENEHHVRMIEK